MKRIWNILILLCAGGGIIAAWFLIPDRLLDLQRREVFCSKVAVPIENVHPYEEEYAKLRKALLRSIHVKTEGQYTILDSETVTEYANLSEDVLGRYQIFLCAWNSSLMNDGIKAENLYICRQDGECSLAIISYPAHDKKQNIYVPNLIYIEPTSGIPIDGSVFIDMKELGITVNDLWSELVDAYSGLLGITIYDMNTEETPVEQNTMELFEWKSVAKVIDVKCAFYGRSKDGSYHLKGSFDWFSSDELIFDFELIAE